MLVLMGTDMTTVARREIDEWAGVARFGPSFA
jgi:hypothetical protein